MKTIFIVLMLLAPVTSFCMDSTQKKDNKVSEVLKLQSEDTTFVVPMNLALHLKVIQTLIKDVEYRQIIPVASIDAKTLKILVDHLPLVDAVSHHKEDSLQLLLESLEKLSTKSLLRCMMAANYLEVVPLLKTTFLVACVRSDLLSCSWTIIKRLPKDLRNKLIQKAAVQLFGPDKKQELIIASGHEKRVSCVAVTDSGIIISGSSDATVRVWDAKGNQCAICKGHKAQITSLATVGDDTIVSGSDDGTIRIWNVEGDEKAVCKGHTKGVCAIAITDDMKIVSCSVDQTIRVWDLNGQQLSSWEFTKEHKPYGAKIMITNNGSIIAGSISLSAWTISGDMLGEFKRGSNTPFACTHDGFLVDVGSMCNAVGDIPYHYVNSGNVVVEDVTVTADNKIAFGSWDKTLRVLDRVGNPEVVCEQSEAVYVVKALSDGTILSCSRDNTTPRWLAWSFPNMICLWDSKGTLLASHYGHKMHIEAVAATSDKIILGSSSKEVLIWNYALPMSLEQAEKVWAYLKKCDREEDGWKQVRKLAGLDTSLLGAAHDLAAGIIEFFNPKLSNSLGNR